MKQSNEIMEEDYNYQIPWYKEFDWRLDKMDQIP